VANIIARYCEKELPLARVWIRSWRARGWKTGIRFDKRERWVSLRVINFSLKRRGSPEQLKWKRYGVRGWLTSPLVKFPAGATEDDVLNCGRPL